MSNVPWMSRWQRSPRQDRRVVENGKFVEQGQVQLPEPPPEVPEQEQSALEIVQTEKISGTVFEEARYDESVDTETASAGGNVPLDTPNGPSEGGLESSGESNDSNPREAVGVTEEVSNPSVSTAEGPSVSEASQAELEPIDAVAEHVKGSQTIAEIIEALEPLPGAVLTEEQSDALAETLRLPGPPDEDLPF